MTANPTDVIQDELRPIPIPFDAEMIDAIASYARADREQGPPCANCGKPVEVGQVVLPWDDAGEMHADCEHPFSLKYERGDQEPEPVILLGEPMRHVPLAALQAAQHRQEACSCADIAYRICAESRHVTLGDKIRAALTAAQGSGGTEQ